MRGAAPFSAAQAAVNTLIALHAMPKGETEIRLTKDGAVAIERLSRARFLCVYVVHMARIALGVVLIWFGSIYLVRRQCGVGRVDVAG